MTVKKSPEENASLKAGLSAWGLSRPETEVYLYLLQRPTESGGSKIAIGTKLHRQYVYIALDKLLELGLVEGVTHGKHKRYKARPPAELEKITRKRSLAANDLVHELDKISAIHNNQDFEVLQGVKQIRQYELDYAESAEAGEEELIIGGYSGGFRELMGDELEEYLDDKAKKSIRVQYLGSESERETYKGSIGKFPNQEYRFLKKLPQGVTHMVVRRDTVLFYSFLTPPLVYVIKSKTVADNYKQFFAMLWDTFEKKS